MPPGDAGVKGVVSGARGGADTMATGVGRVRPRAHERRAAMLELLRRVGRPVTGAQLAGRFGVTRAVVVHDLALLRAAGEPIVATPAGYVYGPSSRRAHTAQVAVRHGPSVEEIERELTALVDEGVLVRDVVVDHPLYGELRGLLMVASRRDVAEFCRRMRETGAEPLLSLDPLGTHLHTLEADDSAALERARAALRRLGMLAED